MERQAGRRFGLLDAMALVAATAIGLGVLRATHLTGGLKGLLIPWGLGGHDRARAVCEGMLFVSPVLAMWSLAVVVLALRRGRPRRFAAQPGFVAGVVAVLGIPLGLFFLPFDAWGTNGNYGWVEVSAIMTGFATIASWLTLVLAGIWRPRAHWLDRLGRALGLLWIGMAVVAPVLLVFRS